MTALLYVPPDAHGIEHTAGGRLGHRGDRDIASLDARAARLLGAPVALLDVLDERIYRAEPVGHRSTPLDGVVSAVAARLTDLTSLNTESATGLSLDCAAHAHRDTRDWHWPMARPCRR